MAAEAYTKTGNKSASPAALPKEIFGIEVKSHLLVHQAYVAYLANGRGNLAITKKRGQVSGGGKKPWRQKGTGRARFGSSRNPIWRGGGVAFGPTGNENYSKKLSPATKHQALRQALSISAASGKLNVIDAFDCGEGKVKPVLALLSKLKLSGSVLVVVGQKDAMTIRATRNLENVKVVQPTYLNVYDIINADNILISRDTVEAIKTWLGDSK